jgi:HEAT repeat protein
MAKSIVPELSKCLRSKDRTIRERVLSVFLYLEEESAPASNQFIQILRDPKEPDDIRKMAANALAWSGPEGVRKALSFLRDEDPVVRTGAADALYNVGDRAKGAIPSLVDALSDPEERVQSNAQEALTQLGVNAIPEVRKALGHRIALTRINAAHVLLTISAESREGVLALTKELTNKDETARKWAAFHLADAGNIGELAAGELVRALGDKAPDVRYWAVHALGKIRKKPKVVVPALVKRLKDPEEKIRVFAVHALAAFGKESAPSVSELIKVFGNERPSVRLAIIDAVVMIGRPALSALPLLEEAAKSENEEERSRAATALRAMRRQYP